MKFALFLTMTCLLLVTGCSGEPTYAKPTGTGVKDKNAAFKGAEGQAKGLAPLGKD